MLAKVAKRADESRKVATSALSGKTVTFDLHRAGLSEHDDEVKRAEDGFSESGGKHEGGMVPLTPDEKKEKRQVQNQTKRATKKPNTSQKRFNGPQSGSKQSNNNKARTARHLEVLSQK